ncbi:MAG: 1,2-dihydroxy-3-keto-5-methylthiopentene dioxygenase [Gammaproteobacteria bacterium]
MSALTVYQEDQPQTGESFFELDQIQERLAALDVRFERWVARFPLPDDADQATVLKAYQGPIEQLKEQFGFKSVDVISLHPDHPEKAALRNKFLSEHTHDDFEVRFFIEGRGMFCLHFDNKVYSILCEQGDLISVPAGVRHWFDMGEAPHFKCIRLFTTPEGWVANFTGSEIARNFPTLDQYVSKLP